MLKLCVLVLAVQCVFGRNLVDTLTHNGQTTLVSLIESAGLKDALNSGTFTIFAPSNAAFAKLPAALLNHLSTDVNALADVLKFHVVSGNVRKSDAANELELPTLEGNKARINIYSHNNVVTLEGVQITDFDIRADNGYIHVLDSVMLPPEGSIVDVVAGASELSTLLAQVQDVNLAAALQGNNLTLFAPTNDAFARLGSSTLQKITSDKRLLKEILEYHVVPHTEFAEGIYNREYLRTLDSHHDHIRISVSGSRGVYVNNAHVIKADIAATNGVVHLIDHVLVPIRYAFSLGK